MQELSDYSAYIAQKANNSVQNRPICYRPMLQVEGSSMARLFDDTP